MSEISNWIEECAREQSRSLPMCHPSLAEKIVSSAREKFVVGNPRVWWLSLTKPPATFNSEKTTINEILPSIGERVWFIPETEEPTPTVYELYLEDIELIRRNCPLFEYYVTNRGYDWLLIENDHDEFLLVK